MTQMSTAFSDFILSLASFYVAAVVYRHHTYASIGFSLVGIAAAVGVIRFSGSAPIQRQHSLVTLHSRLSWLATILGIPLLGAAFCLKYNRVNSSQLHIVSAIAGITLSFLFPNLRDACTRFPSTLGILSTLFQCYSSGNMFGVAGAILYAVSGTLIGTSGYIMAMRSIDVFHYCLAIANMVFLKALQH